MSDPIFKVGRGQRKEKRLRYSDGPHNQGRYKPEVAKEAENLARNPIFKVGRGQRKEKMPEKGQEAENLVKYLIFKVGRGQRKEKMPE